VTRSTATTRVWTHADFDEMGWHDATIHAFAIDQDQFELMFDLDYIVEWVRPEDEGGYFSFWVAPATLVFEGVQDVSIEIAFPHIRHIDVFDLHREPAGKPDKKGVQDWAWRLELADGAITFRANGFRQHFRAEPVHRSIHPVAVAERGGISFARG